MVIKLIAQLSPHGGRLRLFQNYFITNAPAFILSVCVCVCVCVCFPAEVWEKEFDPIMVILRTVYRRDVQSAMDRYAALWVSEILQTSSF